MVNEENPKTLIQFDIIGCPTCPFCCRISGITSCAIAQTVTTTRNIVPSFCPLSRMDVVVTIRDGVKTTRISADELANEIKDTADHLYEKAMVDHKESTPKVLTQKKDQN